MFYCDLVTVHRDCPNFRGVRDVALGNRLTAAKMGLSPSASRLRLLPPAYCLKNAFCARHRPLQKKAKIPAARKQPFSGVSGW